MNNTQLPHLLGISHALAAAIILGLFSAIADWIWFRFLEDGAMLPALVHGLVFFLIIALVLAPAGPHRRTAAARLLVTLPLVGVGLAAIFYPLAAVAGYLGALLITWAGMWIGIALLLRWSARQASDVRQSVVRGLLAAILSGAAFATVSWMWTAPAPGGPSVPLHFVCWTWALLPGFATLLLRRDPDSTRPHQMATPNEESRSG